MRSVELRVDVTEAAGLGERAHVALTVTLPDDPRIRDLCLTPTNLEVYDELAKPPKK